MSEIKLLPCTHCENGKAVLHVNELTDKYHVVCCDCGCRTADFKHPEEAVAKWNTRKPMERILTRLEERHKNHDNNIKKYQDKIDYDMCSRHSNIKVENEISIEIVKEEGGIE